MHDVLIELVRDKTAWLGSAGSIVATAVTKAPSIKMPETLEGWAAFTLSAVTIFYIITKTFILIRNHRKDKQESS